MQTKNGTKEICFFPQLQHEHFCFPMALLVCSCFPMTLSSVTLQIKNYIGPLIIGNHRVQFLKFAVRKMMPIFMVDISVNIASLGCFQVNVCLRASSLSCCPWMALHLRVNSLTNRRMHCLWEQTGLGPRTNFASYTWFYRCMSVGIPLCTAVGLLEN